MAKTTLPKPYKPTITPDEMAQIRARYTADPDARRVLAELDNLRAFLDNPPDVVERWMGIAYDERERAAVLAERERCAKKADALFERYGEAALALRDAIRSGEG